MTYTPHFFTNTVDMTNPVDYTTIQNQVESGALTHIRDTNGEVFKLLGRLNKKSAPTSHELPSGSLKRVPFTKVESFGAPSPEPADAGEGTRPHHTERAHALLSASSSHRWLNCPPSAVIADKHPQPADSPAAAEGTAAHELAEHKLRKALKLRDRKSVV